MAKLCALACVLFFALAGGAEACPAGTVFSHFGENCHWKGRGRDEAAKCTVKRGACPAGSKRMHSRETKRDVCCPTVAARKPTPMCRIDGTAPFCAGSCWRGEREAGRFAKGTMGCVTGQKVRCCR
jgi:hypothetical protein